MSSDDVSDLSIIGPGNGSQMATNVVLFGVVVNCYQICDLLRLFHFITDRRQTLHTQRRKGNEAIAP